MKDCAISGPISHRNQSFLSNRQMKVVLHVHYSWSFCINANIPQASIIAATLFLMSSVLKSVSMRRIYLEKQISTQLYCKLSLLWQKLLVLVSGCSIYKAVMIHYATWTSLFSKFWLVVGFGLDTMINKYPTLDSFACLNAAWGGICIKLQPAFFFLPNWTLAWNFLAEVNIIFCSYTMLMSKLFPAVLTESLFS